MTDKAKIDRQWLKDVGILILLCFGLYAWWKIECPACHAGNISAEGRCSLGDACPHFYLKPKPFVGLGGLPIERKKYVWEGAGVVEWIGVTGKKGHRTTATCFYCKHTGKMSRYQTWGD